MQTQTDHVLMAQSALLLSYWCPSLGCGEKNSNSLWLNHAIQHAKALKAHKRTSTFNSLDFASLGQRKHDNTLRRIWWCCVIRDRILSLCVRRNIQVSRDYLDRHASCAISYDDFSNEIERSRVYDANTKHSLITVMFLMIELCLCLSDVLTVAHSTRDLTTCDSRDTSRRTLQVYECKKDLETWAAKAVASSPVMASTQHGRLEGRKPQGSVLMFANLVWIYYQ